ncbi:MAG: PfkB family carbohydrate kinase [Solirubrobacteraceae bacterium]
MTTVAVVGHVEWVHFLRVDRPPARGDVIGAERISVHAGGGAVVAAAVLAQLGATVELFCALGSDANGDAAEAELAQRGIAIHAVRRPGPTREVITFLDEDGERTIVTIGARLAPHGSDDLSWDRLRELDGVYLTAGDAGAVHNARAAPVLVATPRVREQLNDHELILDALVLSASDASERGWARRLASGARLIVQTEGADGGRWRGESEGRWDAVTPPGPARDSYGCGDAFAAGFTYGLARGLPAAGAADIGARCGAEMLTRVGGP